MTETAIVAYTRHLPFASNRPPWTSLAAGGTVGTASFAGCLGLDRCVGGIFGPNMPHDGEIATDRVDSIPDGASIIEFSALSDAERAVVRTAIDDGVVRACLDDGGRADAIDSFANRMDGESTYLAADGDRYGLWVRIEDMVFAGTADSPGTNGNPCC